MNNMERFIVWDWNGTLIEDTPLCVACFNAILVHGGKKQIDILRYQNTFEVPIQKFYLKNGYSESELSQAMDAFQHIFHDSYDRGILSVGFREGAKETLQTTHEHNVRHIILSNHLIPSIENHLNRMDAKHFFWRILAHANREAQKTWSSKGEHIKEFMRHHGLRPENGLIIGDTPEETHIARQTGLTSIAITGGFATEERLHEVKPDYVIDSLNEMPSILSARGFTT
ncbi:MAG: HAD family hydrolase [Alphaproteobacteria bacterium]|nr:HAD family hydrolase [Alphaproteobacteria bacterium]